MVGRGGRLRSTNVRGVARAQGRRLHSPSPALPYCHNTDSANCQLWILHIPPPWFKQAYRSGAKKTSWNAWLKTFCESIYFNHCASNSYYWFKWPLKASRNKINYLKISRNRVDGGGRRLHIGRPSRVECIFIVFLYQTTLLLRSSTFYFLWALMFLQKVLLYAGSGEMYTL